MCLGTNSGALYIYRFTSFISSGKFSDGISEIYHLKPSSPNILSSSIFSEIDVCQIFHFLTVFIDILPISHFVVSLCYILD